MIKVATWNCGGAFRKKYELLERAFNPDVMVIQECENPESSTTNFLEWAGSYLWVGESKHKGLAVFDRSHRGLQALEWPSNGLQTFLPCRIGELLLLAIWTKHANSPNFRYIGQVWKYLQLYGERLRGESVCLVGDWNSNTQWDEWDRWWNHSDVVNQLERMGIQSVYHEHYSESQGAESKPTLYHRKDMSKPYHVDFGFASGSLKPSRGFDVQVGLAEEWLQYSDHMPLCFCVAS